MRTRTIRYPDGRQEILRVLSNVELSEWKPNGPLSYEKSIVWLEDINRLPFVRVVDVTCAKSRRGRLSLQGRERVIGYSKLMADAPRDPKTTRFTRRLFYLKEGEGPETPPPVGRAVNPRTILPGIPGEASSAIVTRNPEATPG